MSVSNQKVSEVVLRAKTVFFDIANNLIGVQAHPGIYQSFLSTAVEDVHVTIHPI
jgi:hypothetical protein